MQLVSRISPWRGWLERFLTSGAQKETCSTPNRFSKWDVVRSQRDGQFQVVNSSHRVVATCYELDDAESIMAQHNKALSAREEWYGA